MNGVRLAAQGHEITQVIRTSRPLLLPQLAGACRRVERVMGIEPTLSGWEPEVLPLNYTRPVPVSTGEARRPGSERGASDSGLRAAMILRERRPARQSTGIRERPPPSRPPFLTAATGAAIKSA